MKRTTRAFDQWKRRRHIFALFPLCAAMAAALSAQTVTTLFSFNGADGYNPMASLVQAEDGNLYGTANLGGAVENGTLFKITPTGAFTLVYSFCSDINCPEGARPAAALVQATNGDLYGTTTLGAAASNGAAFKITSGGTVTSIYTFCALPCQAGGYRPSGLIQATDLNFYGTTAGGGTFGNGTVFKLTPSGTLTTIPWLCSIKRGTLS